MMLNIFSYPYLYIILEEMCIQTFTPLKKSFIWKAQRDRRTDLLSIDSCAHNSWSQYLGTWSEYLKWVAKNQMLEPLPGASQEHISRMLERSWSSYSGTLIWIVAVTRGILLLCQIAPRCLLLIKLFCCWSFLKYILDNNVISDIWFTIFSLLS